MNAEQVELLRKIGLSTVETKTYLTLLETGKSLAGTVAKRAHLHRRNTYDALENLLQKGLVSYIISNNRKQWNAVHPDKILSLLKENEGAIASFLPELITTFNTSKSKQSVAVFEGLGGMKTFFDDMINTKKEIIMLFATGKAYVRLPYYMKKWDMELNKNKIRVKVLLNPDVDKTPYHNYTFGEIKTLPLNFSTPTQIFIYGNKSVVAIWSEEPIAVQIISDEITAGFQKYYEFLWKIAK